MASVFSNIKIAPCETHHLKDNKPLYKARFFKVSKFHEPGLSPVVDKDGAFHITLSGEPAYPQRFIKTFGFYNNLAAVEENKGWFHILSDGSSLYKERYTWCGNFQEGFCPVRNQKQEYFHITLEGIPLYSHRYNYVGDFKDGIAVICDERGQHTHINNKGTYLHHQWFNQLDIFHKDFARAKDAQGWFHINKKGEDIYKERYATIEPFYNGVSHVEDFKGRLLLINERGEQVKVIADAAEDNNINKLSDDMVGFWKTWTLYTAIELKTFDCLPASLEVAAEKTSIPFSNLKRLFKALWELDIIKPSKNNAWELTAKGQYLKPIHTPFMAAAGIMWGHVNRMWENLPGSLKNKESQYFSSFKEKEADPDLIKTYHLALDGYTAKEFSKVVDLPFWDQHEYFLGFERSSLFMLSKIMEKNSSARGRILANEKVLQGIIISPLLTNRLEKYCWNIGDTYSLKADVILFPKFLHYFPDGQVENILKQSKSSLKKRGKIYILEMLLDETTSMGGLFDLNMLVESGGKVRSLEEWKILFSKTQLKLEGTHKVSPVLTILVVASK